MEELIRLYRHHFGSEVSRTEPLSPSGSARQYFRLFPSDTSLPSVIGCLGTVRAENEAFFTISSAMREAGVSVPSLVAVSEDAMSYIQEDLGGVDLFSLVRPSIGADDYPRELLSLLKSVIASLPLIQLGTGRRMSASAVWQRCFPSPQMDRRMVRFDLNYFKYCFLRVAGIALDELRLQDEFDALETAVFSADFPDAFMYRDFQSRNVMIKDGRPFFIDFQGGRRGPLGYDLSSFVRNASTCFPSSVVKCLEQEYRRTLESLAPQCLEGFDSTYPSLSLLRLLQECGAYGLRGLVERKRVFLEGIPGLLEVCGRFECADYPYISELLSRVAESDAEALVAPKGDSI